MSFEWGRKQLCVMLGLHCRHFTWNGLEWPGITAMPNRCTKISAGTGTGTGTVIVTVPGTVPGTVTVTVTVTVPGPVPVTVPVPVTRLGALGSGCESCGLLYGCYEARSVEGWLSMLLRQRWIRWIRCNCAICGCQLGSRCNLSEQAYAECATAVQV